MQLKLKLRRLAISTGLLLLFFFLLFVLCNTSSASPLAAVPARTAQQNHQQPRQRHEKTEKTRGRTQQSVRAPAEFFLRMGTSLFDQKTGLPLPPVVLRIVRQWSPLGVDHLYALLQDKFYDDSAFFRVVPGFVVQFGIAGTPAMNKKWMNSPIKDEPVLQSNLKGTVAYATDGPNSRTTQLFINYVDNVRLDGDGFSPFGVVVSGLETAVLFNNPTPGNSNGVSNSSYTAWGNTWIQQAYPNITMLTTMRLMNSLDLL